MRELEDPAEKLRELREAIRLKTRYLLEKSKHTDSNGHCSPEGVVAARKACGLDPIPPEGEGCKRDS